MGKFLYSFVKPKREDGRIAIAEIIDYSDRAINRVIIEIQKNEGGDQDM